MDEVKKEQLRKKINDSIEKFESEIIQLEEATQPISPENSIGRISRMDAIKNKSVLEAALRNKKDKLGRLLVAKRKLGDKDFGLCQDCGNPIVEGRLMFMPERRRCIRCASRIDKV